MDENEAVDALRNAGLDVERAIGSWRESVQLLAALDAIGRDGASALVKIDGGRDDGRVYTVVVSGGALAEGAFRKDGAELRPLLDEAVAFCAAHGRGGGRGAT